MNNKKIMSITGIITIITLIVAIIGEIIPKGYFENIYFLSWLTGHRNFGISLFLGLSTGCFIGCITAFINWKTDLLEKENDIKKLLKNIYADSRALSNLLENSEGKKESINEIEIRNKSNYLITLCDRFIYMDKSIIEGEKCESINRIINYIKNMCLNMRIDIRDEFKHIDTIWEIRKVSNKLRYYSDEIKSNMLEIYIKDKDELKKELDN